MDHTRPLHAHQAPSVDTPLISPYSSLRFPSAFSRHPPDASPEASFAIFSTNWRRSPAGAPRHVPRRQHPRCPWPLLPAQHLPEQTRQVGGDRPRRHWPAWADHQAHLLRREPETVPGPVRPDSDLRPCSDGLGIMRDDQTAKPQTFVTGDGWFVYNLAANLARM